ncbi:MAG: glycosyltransferase family 2 protein [Acidobacteriota bacterium]
MKPLSGVVICRNEAAKIRACLASLSAVCDEIVVVDSGSTDETVALCQQFTDRVYVEPWRGYRDQKQRATDLASSDWVLSLDADERLSPALEREIIEWKREGSVPLDGYRMPRVTFFLGRWIRHSTWYPDRQLRLYRRSCGRWVGGRVHERFEVATGRVGDLSGEIQHFTYGTVDEYLDQLKLFSRLAAEDQFERGRRARLSHLLFHPVLAFGRNYIWRWGVLDGFPGLAVAWLAAVSTAFKYLKLYEIQSQTGRARGSDGDRRL